MDSRTDFQRLLEDMDRALRRKQQELSELDERLEAAREQLSEKEAKEMLLEQESSNADGGDDQVKKQDVEALIQEQRSYYEAKLSALTEELIEIETSNQFLAKSNGQLQFEVDSLKVSNEKLRTRAQKLTDNLDEVQSANFELNIRLAKSESQSQMQQKLLIKSNEQDQILLNAFNSKLESLKEAIAVRDKEIKRLRLDNQLTLQSLGVAIDQVDSDGLGDASDNLDNDSTAAIARSATSNNLKLDSGKQIFIRNLIRERDAQITQLNEQLMQATRELENNATLIETLTSERVNAKTGTPKEVPNARVESSELDARCRMLEIELNEKDRQLHWIDKRIRHFESILPDKITELIEDLSSKLKVVKKLDSAADNDEAHQRTTLTLVSTLCEGLNSLRNELSSSQRLMNTIDQLQHVILSRDEHIKRLVRELNALNAQITNDHVNADAADGDGTDEPEHRKAIDSTQIVQSGELDEQNSAHKTEKETNLEIGGDGSGGGGELASQSNGVVTKSDLEAVAESTNLELDESPSEPASRGDNGNVPRAERESDRERQSSDERLNLKCEHVLGGAKVTDDQAAPDQTIQTNSQLESATCPNQVLVSQESLRQLENENRLLELAMKEILLSIKWSDTKCSTILIDCPSLERLCQLMEARYITDDLSMVSNSEDSCGGDRPSSVGPGASLNCDIFQFVVMKSELDILRGQNEQLRTDLKLYRRNWRAEFEGTSNRVEQRPSNNLSDSSSSLNTQRERLGTCEMECQTDSLVLIEPEQFNLCVQRQSQAMEDRRSEDDAKCKNCSRLVRLANHLLDCIVRIEERVNASDESHISRLLTLYQLTQRLSTELASKDSSINQLRRDYHALSQRKIYAESRWRALETNFEIHNRFCPLNGQTLRASNKELARTWQANARFIPSLSIRSNQDQVEVPLKDNRITIALIQSLINCLQARLECKDERLNQLERILAAS